MIEEWEKYKFSNCLVDNNVSRSNQINASEKKPTGKYPVIDQGQDFIAGYTDEEEKLVSEGLPYIIFGDHTRCFKYVDFPFVVGADGTKVLSPNKDLFDPKFFYFHLLSFDIPSRGYNRHYKLLKEKIVLRPELPEQRKIAYVLSTVQKAIEQQDKLIRTTTELKKALMQKLFTEGIGWLSGAETRQKQTEIGQVPEDWEVVELGEICERISINVQPNPNGNKPYVGLEHIFSGQIYLTDWGTEKEVVSSKAAFKKGYILYGKLRPYLDKAVIAPFDGISSTDILIFNGKNEVENDFLIHFFHTDRFIEFAKSTTSGVQHPRTSWNSLKKIKLGLPLKSERKFIAKTLNIIENKIQFHQKKKQTLTALFKTLLHELMTGQRRVHEIEFEALNNEVKEMSTSL